MVTYGLIALVVGLLAWAALYYKSSVFGKMIWHVKTNQKVIALTFDDGPNDPYTEQIADIIESYGGKATFFVVGKNCERYPKTAQTMQRRGHQIGLHSYSHAFRKYFFDPLFRAELAKSRAVLKTQGVRATAFRFPWLFRTPWLIASVKKAGLGTPVSGQFSHPLEPFQVDARRIVEQTLRIARPGAIIIFHDGYNAQSAPREQTVEAVRRVTKVLAKQGYQFVTVDQLLACKD